ncbi:MAG: hypothetical protein KDA46_15250, partial [Parvularculaceae bacterium]|nr:hypothetical protein [Parvularculaceae bacterium]
MSLPRLLLIDLTPIGGGSATGELKAMYFGDWPAGSLMHLRCRPDGSLVYSVYSHGDVIDLPTPQDEYGVLQTAKNFDPEFIMYRPVADHAALHHAAMRIITDLGAPYSIWIMDDWLARLQASDETAHACYDEDLRRLFSASAANFAISKPMAEALGRQYDCAMTVARNGVIAADWPEPSTRRHGEPLSIRYAGSLAKDTTRESVRDVANAVARLRAEGLRMEFEIRTQQTWLDEFGAALGEIDGVSVKLADFPPAQYRQWLCDADIALVAYNFDDETRRYLHSSFANKVPELLATGAAVLAYGPPEL